MRPWRAGRTCNCRIETEVDLRFIRRHPGTIAELPRVRTGEHARNDEWRSGSPRRVRHRSPGKGSPLHHAVGYIPIWTSGDVPLWKKRATHTDPSVLGLAEIRPNKWSDDQLDILTHLARRRDFSLAWTYYRAAWERFRKCMTFGRPAYEPQVQVRFFRPARMHHRRPISSPDLRFQVRQTT